MSFIKSIQHRYTTKIYDNSRKIEVSKIEELKEILRMSPSSINSQPWKFIFISDTTIKNKLADASFFNGEKIKNCDTLVVFSRINNIQLFEHQIKETLPKSAVDFYNHSLKQQSDEQKIAWFDKQVYLALGIFLSACAEMEIDSTPMEGIDLEKYDNIIGSNDYHSLAAVAIGYRDINDFNQVEKTPKLRRPINQVVEAI